MLWIPCFIIYWFRGFSLALQLRQFLCHFILRNFVRQVQRKRERARQSGKKRKFITGKREADWPLRRTSVLPFWQSPSYTLPKKNSLEGWSCSPRVVLQVWEDKCQWDNRMPFGQLGQSQGSLWFILCFKVDITSHLIGKTPCGLYHPCLLIWQEIFQFSKEARFKRWPEMKAFTASWAEEMHRAWGLREGVVQKKMLRDKGCP